MSVGTWTPDPTPSEQANSIDPAFLQHCISVMPADLSAIELNTVISDKQQANNAVLMRLDAQSWEAATAEFSAEDMYALMRFFTLAEMQFPGWEADANSPVVWLNKILRRRGEPLGRDQVLWIKQNTRNRFLPNGAIL